MAHCASVRSMPSSTDSQYTLVSPCRFGICEIGSSVANQKYVAKFSGRGARIARRDAREY